MPSRQQPRIAEWQLEQLRDLVAETLGLDVPRERLGDLRRVVASASEELGFHDPAECLAWLVRTHPTKAQLDVLASHLTVGETYFLRDPKTFDILESHILPKLIDARRGREQRLRLWSAACCSGEEAYSIAMVVRRLLPDLADWQVTLLATDVNARFLQKAIAAVYGEWSFRGTPPRLRQRYFSRTADGRYALLPEIRRMVTFAHLNLVEDVYPSLATDTNAMDVIFCRNALMYFTPGQARRVIANLHRALVAGGWLAVGPSETSTTRFTQFATRNFPGVILYQKGPPATARHPRGGGGEARAPALAPPTRLAVVQTPPAAGASSAGAPRTVAAALESARSLYARGQYEEAVRLLLPAAADRACEHDVFSLLTRALANAGRLAEALAWGDRWVAADTVNAGAHYLRGMILLEQGSAEEAYRSLRRAVYLQPDLVPAHVALGAVADRRGRRADAERHFRNALHLLARLQSDDVLAESEGLTAGRLTETINTLRAARAGA